MIEEAIKHKALNLIKGLNIKDNPKWIRIAFNIDFLGKEYKCLFGYSNHLKKVKEITYIIK